MGLKVLAILVTYILAIYGGSPFVTMILRRFGVVQEEGLERAGKIIGYLERFLVLTLVLHGQYTAIAFIFTGPSQGLKASGGQNTTSWAPSPASPGRSSGG